MLILYFQKNDFCFCVCVYIYSGCALLVSANNSSTRIQICFVDNEVSLFFSFVSDFWFRILCGILFFFPLFTGLSVEDCSGVSVEQGLGYDVVLIEN